MNLMNLFYIFLSLGLIFLILYPHVFFKKAKKLSDLKGKVSPTSDVDSKVSALRDEWDRSGTDTFTMNMVIAEFMGGRPYSDVMEVTFEMAGKFTCWNFPKDFYPMRNGEITAIQGLDFHRDWNWLMPVVFKIRDIEQQRKMASGVRFAFTTEYKTMTIESVWKSVVSFITWYNQNKLK